jgi:7-cyano-7-deazaguanine reductase
MSQNPLGKEVPYKSIYDNSLLFSIPRKLGRDKLNIDEKKLPFSGFDFWNWYEVSWLNVQGKPQVRIIEFIVPADSEYLVESKSIKLYLNSFNNTKFNNDEEVLGLIKADLIKAAKAPVEIIMKKLSDYNNSKIGLFDGICIDDIDVEIEDYQVNSNLLTPPSVSDETIVEETLCSNLFKSNCLVTGQPDWASVEIKYKGKKINYNSLLKYLISYRNHNGFHEECVEHIFMDILNIYQPIQLSVFAKYTRRGGIDINPFRTNLDLKNTEINKIRDVRQ